MSKIKTMNSKATANKYTENDKIYMAKMSSSFMTFAIVFFFIAPLIYYTTLDLLELILPIKFDGSSSLITIIGILFHFIFAFALSALAIKWKNKYLMKKTLRAHWTYNIILSLLLIIFTGLRHI